MKQFSLHNDTYGHAFGDLVLKCMCAYIKENLGPNAWIGRYGGEEFVLFFGRSDVYDVEEKVNELRIGISNLKLSDGTQEATVTASFGISFFPDRGETIKQLMEKADTALYVSKGNGRNTVTTAN